MVSSSRRSTPIYRAGLAAAGALALTIGVGVSVQLYDAIWALRASLQTSVKISIGSEIQIPSRIALDKNAPLSIEAPAVRMLAVKQVKLVPAQPLVEPSAGDDVARISAVTKPEEEAFRPERAMLGELSHRFKEVASTYHDGSMPELPTIIEEEPEEFDRAQLAAVLREEFLDGDQVVGEKTPEIAVVKQIETVDIQKVDTHKELAKEPAVTLSAMAKDEVASSPAQQSKVPAAAVTNPTVIARVQHIYDIKRGQLAQAAVDSDAAPVTVKPVPLERLATMAVPPQKARALKSSSKPVDTQAGGKLAAPIYDNDLPEVVNQRPMDSQEAEIVNIQERKPTLVVDLVKKILGSQAVVSQAQAPAPAADKVDSKPEPVKSELAVSSFVVPAKPLVLASSGSFHRTPDRPAPVPKANPAPTTQPTNQIQDSMLEQAARAIKDRMKGLTDGGGIVDVASNKDQAPQPPAPKTIPAYSGVVVEGFTGGKRPVSGVYVQVLGTQLVAQTNERGEFGFDKISIAGVLPVVAGKQGYLKRRVELHAGMPETFELVAENASSSLALVAGETSKNAQSFVFGQLVSLGRESVDAMKIEVQGPTPVQAVYIDASGRPDRNLKMTSSRGQFALFNVTPGTYLVSIMDAFGQERAPHIIHVGEGEGLIRKFSMGERRFIRGKVTNTVLNAPVDQATVQMLGSAKVVTSDRNGEFTLGPVFVDCADLNYLQIEKRGYYRNRVDYSCAKPEEKTLPIYVFPAAYVDGLAMEAQVQLKGTTGVVIGHESFKTSVKMQLWGPEEVAPGAPPRGADYYLENDGVLNPDLNRTGKTGNFTILDAPEGLSYMQSFNETNWTLSYWPILISPSTVNVYTQ